MSIKIEIILDFDEGMDRSKVETDAFKSHRFDKWLKVVRFIPYQRKSHTCTSWREMLNM